MKIGIIGTGAIGSMLALHFGRLRYTCSSQNSRSRGTLAQVGRDSGAIVAIIDTGNCYPLRDGEISEIKDGMVTWDASVLCRSNSSNYHRFCSEPNAMMH